MRLIKVNQILYCLLLVVLMSSFTLISVAQANYRMACKESSHCEGGDADIANTMYKYGFEKEYIFDEPTNFEKIKALFH